MSNGQYRLEAFGLTNVWVLWRIAHGGLDEPEIERATPWELRQQRMLYRSDFGSEDDLALAEALFPRELDRYFDTRRSQRMMPKPPLRMEPR